MIYNIKNNNFNLQKHISLKEEKNIRFRKKI